MSSLNLAGRHSKLSYAEALGLLEEGHIRFLNQLSQIRNMIVHQISQVSFTFAAYLASLHPTTQRAVLKNLLFMSEPKDSLNAAGFVQHAKVVLWAHIVAVLGHCMAQQAETRSRAVIEKERRALAESILANLKGNS